MNNVVHIRTKSSDGFGNTVWLERLPINTTFLSAMRAAPAYIKEYTLMEKTDKHALLRENIKVGKEDTSRYTWYNIKDYSNSYLLLDIL
jgi:hypothetical protein